MVDINDHLREVTEEEAAHYEEYGWAKLDGLVTREFAAMLLDVAMQPRSDTDQFGTWEQMANLPGVEPYRSFFFSERMAGNASRLINRQQLTDEEVPLVGRWRAGRPPPGQRLLARRPWLMTRERAGRPSGRVVRRW